MNLKASRFKASLKLLLTGAPCQHMCQTSTEALMDFNGVFHTQTDQFACERDKRHVKLFLTEANQLDICTRESKQT